jgi:hypothetical protein
VLFWHMYCIDFSSSKHRSELARFDYHKRRRHPITWAIAPKIVEARLPVQDENDAPAKIVELVGPYDE